MEITYVALYNYGVPYGETQTSIAYAGASKHEAELSIAGLPKKDGSGMYLESSEIQVWENGKLTETIEL